MALALVLLAAFSFPWFDVEEVSLWWFPFDLVELTGFGLEFDISGGAHNYLG